MTAFSTMSFEPGSQICTRLSQDDEHLVRDFLAAQAQPVAPKYAATVMLLRDEPSCASHVQVFMMRRAKTMAFVPDAVVFPGGSVRPDDMQFSAQWLGPDACAWAHCMGIGREDARAIVVAAARELFEECGVLLAGTETSTADVDADLLEARAALESHELSFSDMLSSRGLSLRSDLLSLRSRWITPVYHPRRYDTFFFSAALPEGQEPRRLTSESAASEWADPRDMIAAGDEGRLKVMPPTAFNLSSLTLTGSVEAILAERPRVESIMLEPHEHDGGYELRCIIP